MLVFWAGYLVRLHSDWSSDDSCVSTHTQGTSCKRAVTDLVNSSRFRRFHAKCFDSNLQTEGAQWAAMTRILGSTIYGCVLVYPWPSTQGTVENGPCWKHFLVFQGKISKFLHAACQLQTCCPFLHVLWSPRKTGSCPYSTLLLLGLWVIPNRGGTYINSMSLGIWSWTVLGSNPSSSTC